METRVNESTEDDGMRIEPEPTQVPEMLAIDAVTSPVDRMNERDFRASLTDALAPLVSPENAAMMHAFVERSAVRAVAALAVGEMDAYREVLAQSRVMAEEARVRLQGVKWDVFGAAVRGVFATAARFTMTGSIL